MNGRRYKIKDEVVKDMASKIKNRNDTILTQKIAETAGGYNSEDIIQSTQNSESESNTKLVPHIFIEQGTKNKNGTINIIEK